MRINRIQLVGLAALAGVGAAGEASATDRTISTATTTPVTTSQPEPPGNVTPGNITIASGGSITVTTGQTAITVDSSNGVTNNGSITSNDANNTTGILLLGGNTGTILNAGTINLIESYVRPDTGSDGDLDGPFTQAPNSTRYGIRLNGPGTFTGNITNSGTITIEGGQSGAIRLDSLLTGNLTSSGSVSVIGDDSVAFGLYGGVAGDVALRGSVFVQGANSSGLVVDAPITGTGGLRIGGNWTVTGYSFVTRPANITNLDADDLLIGGAAIAIRDNVSAGVTIEGIGVEDDVDDDGDGITEAAGDTNDDASATIGSAGSSPALLVQADALSALNLGVNSAGFGFQIRGSVTASGVYDNIDSTAIRILGTGGGSTVAVAGGLAIDGSVAANAVFSSSGAPTGSATGLFLGSGASTPNILVRRQLTSTVVGEGAQTARALVLGSGASSPILFNSGVIRAQFLGEVGSAVAVLDQSNSMTSITNTGTIEAILTATDADLTDGIPPPPVAGNAIAFDLSGSTNAVTLNQVALTDPLVNPVFADINDDDTVDDNATAVPAIKIVGDILFGSGSDTLNLLAGTITGDLSFGAGADTFVINNGATFLGELSDGDSNLALNVVNGTLELTGGATTISTATFGGGAGTALWRVQLGTNTLAPPVLAATGTVTFGANADIVPLLPTGLPTTAAITFLTAAGGFVDASNVTGPVTGGSYLYDVSIGLASPTAMQASYLIKTPTQLGFSTNEAAAFASILAALRTDNAASNALSGLTTQGAFENAYDDLMPTYASGAAELAATAIQQAQSATTNRLAATRLHDLDEVSVWAQEIGYGLERTPASNNGQAFNGQGFGLAVGIDGPLDSGGLFGLSASFITSEVEDDGRSGGQLSAWFGQANAYLGTAMGVVDLDFVAGLGAGKLESERTVQIGSGYSAQTDSNWWAYELHGAARASVPLALGEHFVLAPQAALTYVGLSEQAYEEDSGEAIDYEADSAFSQRLWADAGVELSARWEMRGGGFIAPRLFAGYRANVIDESAERSFRYLAGGSSFTLQDEGYGEGGPLVGLGIDTTNGYSTLSLSYEGEFGDQIERHSLNASVRFRF